jgi:phosphinothricin acetyltransferase
MRTVESFHIRPADISDLAAITGIYNEAILTTNATFDTELKTVEEQRDWFNSHDTRHSILVAELDDTVIGWVSLSKWSDRCSYADTAEISLYIKESHRSTGTGKKLMGKILIEGEKAGLHTIIARITAGNRISVHLHESFGFEHIGVMREVGVKFGKLLDVYLMQKIYPVNPE